MGPSTRSVGAVLAVGLVALGLLTVAPAPAVASEDPSSSPSNPIAIDSCSTIKFPGYYRLTTNITNSSAEECILIRADDVVFDGGGHVIDGEGPTVGDHRIPIRVGYSNQYHVQNVTVKNVVTTEWHQGIGISRASNNTVRNVTARHSGEYGIYLGDHAENNTVVDSTVVHGGANALFVADLSDHNRIVNNTVRQSANGIAVYQSAHNIVANNTAVNNSQNGIAIEGPTNRVRHNSARSNDDGVFVGGSNNTVADNTVVNNDENGISVGSEDNVVVRNDVRRNGDGLTVDGSRTLVANNTATNNAQKGIVVTNPGRGNLVRDNLASGNGRLGIQVLRAHDNRFRNNTARDNGRDGLLLVNAMDNRVADIVAIDNGNWDYRTKDGSRNNTVANLSVGPRTRLSFDASGAVRGVSSPPLPPGYRPLSGAVRFATVEGTSGSESSITFHLTESDSSVKSAAASVWIRNDEWQQLTAANASARRVSATVPASGGVLVTLTEDGTGSTPETAGQNSTPATSPSEATPTDEDEGENADGTETATGDGTSASGPGFGWLVTLVAVTVGSWLYGKRQ